MMELVYQDGEHYYYYQRWKDLRAHQKFGQSIIFPKATYSPWIDDLEFKSIYAIVAEHTLVDEYRCYELWNLGRQTNKYQGDILEVGVWRGGTGAILAKSSGSHVFMCDTFAGVVKAGERDNKYIGGEHGDTSEEVVKELFKKTQLGNFTIVKGIFPDETGADLSDRTFCLCHIDVDVYISARDIVEWVLPRLVMGGIIIFDDYGFAACEGITELVNDLARSKDLLFLQNINGHGILIKLR